MDSTKHSPQRLYRSKWVCTSLGHYPLVEQFQYHALCPVPGKCGEYILAGSVQHRVVFFLLSSRKLSMVDVENVACGNRCHNKDSVIRPVPIQVHGIEHNTGMVVHLDWYMPDVSESELSNSVTTPANGDLTENPIWRFLSCGTDGLILIWKMRTKHSGVDEPGFSFVVETSVVDVSALCVTSQTPVYATSAFWARHTPVAEELFAASLTSGHLFLSWVSSDRKKRASRLVSILGSDLAPFGLGFRFAWSHDQLLCITRFSRPVLRYICSDWRTGPMVQRATWHSSENVTAVAVSSCSSVAAWSDLSGIVVFVDDLQANHSLTTIRWLGRPFVSLVFITPSILAAVGFDGIPVIFMKKGFPVEWTFHVTLHVPPPFNTPTSKTLVCSARYATRSISLAQRGYQHHIVTTANDHGEVSVWEVEV